MYIMHQFSEKKNVEKVGPIMEKKYTLHHRNNKQGAITFRAHFELITQCVGRPCYVDHKDGNSLNGCQPNVTYFRNDIFLFCSQENDEDTFWFT